MRVTTLHVSALDVCHHQVFLEVKSYKVHAVKREGARSLFVGIYLCIALGKYGIEVSLILRFLEVSHATVL